MGKTQKKKLVKSKIFLIFLSIVHAVFMFYLTLWLIDKDFTYGDEKFLIKWSTVFKKLILKIDFKFIMN